VHSEHFQVYAKPHETARLGLIVAKRIQKTAVGRNKMRRLIRECFRLQQQTWQADFIVRIKKSFVNSQDRAGCYAELRALLDKASQKCQQKS
jgi:ribonuclease P protein component